MVRFLPVACACLAAAYAFAGTEDEARGNALEAVAAAARPIEYIAPHVSVADLSFLARYIGDARVVGLGEATHGTREFFQLKHRLFQYLVEELGFRTFAIEAKFEESLAIDRYIKSGEGDAEELVNGLGFWTWDTEEVIELVRWMRAYNSRGGEQLNFYGFDVQGGNEALQRAVAFVRKHAPDATENITKQFDAFLAFETLEGDAREAAKSEINSPASLTRMQRAAMDLALFVERNEAPLAGKAGARDYQLARGAAQVSAWWLAMALQPDERKYYRSTSVTDVRDRGMANLVHWIRDIEGGDERIALWAHNGHVAMTRDMNDTRVLGMLLEHELGEDYYAIGFAFEKGSFQAFRPATDEAPATFMVHTVTAGTDESVDGLLADVGADAFFVDLGEAASDGAARLWLEVPRRMRWTGARYSDELEAKHPPIPVLDAFDALIFVRETTRARPAARTRARFGISPTWDEHE